MINIKSFIDFLVDLFYSAIMSAQTPTVHPTVTYIETVCKKASAEGFSLHIGQGGYVWKDKKGETFGEAWALSAPLLVLEACIAIEKKQNWNVLEEIA